MSCSARFIKLTLNAEGPTIDYPAVPPSPTAEDSSPSPPPDLARRTHRSNPSTTSSGYLREAEALMAKIKAREISESSDWESRVRGKGRTGPSPRRTLRRLSASEEVKRVAEQDSGDDRPKYISSAQPGSHLPVVATTSSAPLSPIRGDINADDLARFVSSTTFPTSTTISTSFVKHPGPGVGPRVIRPGDVQGIVPEKVGKMRYDQEQMRWVKEGLGRVDEAGESRVGGGSEESEDVFAGMESLKEAFPIVGTRGSSSALKADITGNHDTTRIEGDEEHVSNIEEAKRASPPHRPVPVHAASAPAILTPLPTSGSLRPIRSALRNANSGTPAAGPKKRTGWHESVTPAAGDSGSKRSVSFSDGKKTGKMGALFVGPSGEKIWMPSARTRRIEGILGDMEELSELTALLWLSVKMADGDRSER